MFTLLTATSPAFTVRSISLLDSCKRFPKLLSTTMPNEDPRHAVTNGCFRLTKLKTNFNKTSFFLQSPTMSCPPETPNDGAVSFKNKTNRLTAWSNKLLFGCHKSERTFACAGASSSIEVRLMAKTGQDLIQCYGPYPTKASLVTRLYALTMKQRSAFRCIKNAWHQEWTRRLEDNDEDQAQQPWSDETLLRVFIWVDFDLERAITMLRGMALSHWDNLALRVDARRLADDFASRAVIPLPGIITKASAPISLDCATVIYIRPSRFFAVSDPLRLVTYTMNCMYDRYVQDAPLSASLSQPIILLVNLKGYYVSSSRQQDSFGLEHWISLLCLIQGKRGPVQAERLWLVNASSEFDDFWQAQVQSFCDENGFASRVSFIKKSRHLSQVLESGYEVDLPKDFRNGKASTRELVSDFLNYRRALEEILQQEQKTAQRRKQMYAKRMRWDLQDQTQASVTTEADSSTCFSLEDVLGEPVEIRQSSRRLDLENPTRRRGSTGGSPHVSGELAGLRHTLRRRGSTGGSSGPGRLVMENPIRRRGSTDGCQFVHDESVVLSQPIRRRGSTGGSGGPGRLVMKNPIRRRGSTDGCQHVHDEPVVLSRSIRRRGSTGGSSGRLVLANSVRSGSNKCLIQRRGSTGGSQHLRSDPKTCLNPQRRKGRFEEFISD